MSVITNKDRINENNDRINRLIALVKQKALTSNPKLATTEDEMDATITDKHVGKVVKYLGEGGGAAVGTPFAVGDTVDKLYFNTSVEPDLSALTYGGEESDGASGWAYLLKQNVDNGSILNCIDVNAMSGGEVSGYCIQAGGTFVYASETFEFSGMSFVKGWQNLDENGAVTLSEAYTISQVNQQDLWSSYISKEPFAAGGKYEKNALYIIAEGESEVIENPTAVGDEVTQIYFDTSKSAEEVYNALMQLDWDNPDYDEGQIWLFGGLESDGSKDNNTAITALNMSMDGHNICQIVQKETPIFMYSPNATPSDLGADFENWGWVTTSPLTSVDPFTIGYVRDKDIWGGFLSSSDKFASTSAGPAAPRARRLNITEGSLAINENGKFDVSNMESVDINIKPRMMTAVAEAEMTALLVEENLGQVVKYVGEAELVGTPPVVGDKLSAIYFDTSKTPDFDALSYEIDETSDGMRTRSATILNLASYEGALMINRMSGDNGHAEIIGSGSMRFYINGEGNVGGMEMTPETFGLTAFGWQTDIFDMSDTSQSEFSDTTVTAVNQQDLWSSYISKEPFAAGGKYETDGLYAIAEGIPGTPVAVGDTISALYFDVSKEPDFSAFDFNEDNYNNVSIDFDGGSYYTLSLNKLAGDNSPTGQDEYVMFLGEGELTVYCSFEFENEGVVYYTKGWQQPIIDANGRVDFPEAGVVKTINQQAGGWDTFVSKEPFATGDVFKFDTLVIAPSGSVTVEENGTYDVKDKESVVVAYDKFSRLVSAFSLSFDVTPEDLLDTTEIRAYAFYNSGINSISSDKITRVMDHAFDACNYLQSVDLPNVTYISERALSAINLKTVSIPKVVTIEDYAFFVCNGITSLTIPNTCTSIGTQALRCGTETNKCTFTFEGTTPPRIASDTFEAIYLNKIIVPAGCGEAYKTAENWSNFADYIEEATA